jgi:hypothetical protein
LIGIFPQIKDACCISVSAVGLDLQTQLADAKDSQIQAGKQGRQHDAGDNAKPNRHIWDVRHGAVSSCHGSEIVFLYLRGARGKQFTVRFSKA